MLPILPRHKLESALKSGTLAQEWGTATPPAEIVGTGPFLLREYQPGQRLVFERNPRYWRKAANGDSLPYIDRLVLELVPDQNAELLRLQSGATDLTHSELRSDDYIPVRRAEEAAQRLARTAPQAGHLVHMPAHIYYRVGRFRESIRANIEAVEADERYFASAEASALYRYGYYPHNVHFVLTSAAMGGDGRIALEYADKLDEAVPMEMAQAVVLAQPVKTAGAVHAGLRGRSGSARRSGR